MSKKFQRTVENFTCEHCGALVRGNGYTNHCPVCLWAKHVDVNPGDRAEKCGGMMEPIGVEAGHDVWMLTHRCVTCGFERRNRTAAEDDTKTIALLAKKHADDFFKA